MLLALAALRARRGLRELREPRNRAGRQRAREVGLRKAIGANRAKVMTQYLAEAGVLTIVAAAVALLAVGGPCP